MCEPSRERSVGFSVLLGANLRHSNGIYTEQRSAQYHNINQSCPTDLAALGSSKRGGFPTVVSVQSWKTTTYQGSEVLANCPWWHITSLPILRFHGLFFPSWMLILLGPIFCWLRTIASFCQPFKIAITQSLEEPDDFQGAVSWYELGLEKFRNESSWATSCLFTYRVCLNKEKFC